MIQPFEYRKGSKAHSAKHSLSPQPFGSILLLLSLFNFFPLFFSSFPRSFNPFFPIPLFLPFYDIGNQRRERKKTRREREVEPFVSSFSIPFFFLSNPFSIFEFFPLNPESVNSPSVESLNLREFIPEKKCTIFFSSNFLDVSP